MCAEADYLKRRYSHKGSSGAKSEDGHCRYALIDTFGGSTDDMTNDQKNLTKHKDLSAAKVIAHLSCNGECNTAGERPS